MGELQKYPSIVFFFFFCSIFQTMESTENSQLYF